MSAVRPLPRDPEASVSELMSSPVLTVEIDESLWDAWQLLFVSGLRHLVVMERSGACVGVLSDRSILAEVPATSEHLGNRHVRDVLAMVPLVSVRPHDTPLAVARAMADHMVEAVPVLDADDRLVGIVTESDIVRWLVR